jgi:hypothetical protein
MKVGEKYLLRHFVAGKPSLATIINCEDYLIVMEGINDNTGKTVRFIEHESTFKRRWCQQLNLFDMKRKSRLGNKYLK